ncbi:MAG: hypothetical protein QM817_15605 [Archangium sp.]
MIALALVLAAAPSSPSLEVALQNAVQRTPARVELTSWDAPRRCKGAFMPAPFDMSGRVAVKVKGKNCEAWGWAEVKVIVPVATLSRDVKANESLDGAWITGEGEARGGVTELPMGATASRAMRSGAAITESDFRVGPRAGTAITVRVMLGALSLEARGTVTNCASGSATCATLTTGKRVAGVFTNGVLVVEGT